MSTALSIGSTWRKWDLHVHTPCSLVQQYGGNTDVAWEAFLTDLEKLPPDFKVIGINDYLFIDGYERVLKEKAGGRLTNIDLFLPVIELRLNKFAGVVKKGSDGSSKSDWNRINLHIIFDALDPDVIRQQFLSALAPRYELIPESTHLRGRWQAVITPKSIAELGQMIIDAAPTGMKAEYGSPTEEGFNNLCVSLESVQDALRKHMLENRFLLAVGKTEWDNMKWNDQSIAEKRHVINCVQVVFTAAESPDNYDRAKARLRESKVLDKLLDCSDAHAFSASKHKDRIGNCFTWIKADPTFSGLRQAVTEFEERVFVGDEPPKRRLVSSNRTKFVSSLSVRKKAGSAVKERWFDVDVPLNSDLVAVIGNKGSGKSALADIAALIGDTRNHGSFSFLNEHRFRDPKSKLASHFIGTLKWHDGTTAEKALDESPVDSSVERVKYLPQSYLETLCNELAGSGSVTFDSELRKIIFTHVPLEERLGYQSLDELLNFKVSEIEVERKQTSAALSKLNAEIVAIEHKMAPAYRETLLRQLELKKGELAALTLAKPEKVDDPQESEASKQETEAATKRISELETTLRGLANEEAAAKSKKADAVKASAQVAKILQSVSNQQRAHEQFIKDLSSMLAEVPGSPPAESIIAMKTELTGIEKLATGFRSTIEEQDILLSSQLASSIAERRQAASTELKALTSKLGEKQRLFLAYRAQIAKWEKDQAELQGSAEKPQTIAWYTAEIERLIALPDTREKLRSARRQLLKALHGHLEKQVAEYRTLYRPVQTFVQTTSGGDMPMPLEFEVRIAEEGFQESFLSRINRQNRGSFSGIEESTAVIRRIINETDFTDAEAVAAFADRIDDLLHFDRRGGAQPAVEMTLGDQLRKSGKPEELYDHVFGLSYLAPKYSLTYGGQEIGQLSPGERGLLLLVFYLLVDRDDIPLVIDQPEENLDNQTIFKILVRCIKVAKQRRQIIMVTHNPNLAVVCDAEQIIHATFDKATKTFAYVSGALESPAIKACVIEILEGTEPAFLNRKQKYSL